MADIKSVQSIIKEINKKFGDTVTQVGVEDIRATGTLSLGTPGLDYCLYNSLPTKRVIELSGAEGSGKTTSAFLICAGYQRREMEVNPDNPRSILYVDLECTVDPSWASRMGYDMSETAKVPTICFRPEDMSGEQTLDYVREFLKSGEVGLIVIDSLPYLVSQQVYEESFEKKEMGGIAKLLKDFVVRITSLLIKYDCTLIGINQVRENIGGYGNPIITPGGRGWKHSCAVRLMLKKGSFFDEEGNELKSSAESPAGYIMEAAVLKTKVCKWDRKVGRTYINYTTGVDILQDTIEVATYLGLIDNSVQGSFKVLDPDTGEVLCDEEGNEVKIRGKKNLKPYFEEHKDIWKKLYDKVYELISKKEDPHIIAFEEMLGIENVAEHFGVDVDKEEE